MSYFEGHFESPQLIDSIETFISEAQGSLISIFASSLFVFFITAVSLKAFDSRDEPVQKQTHWFLIPVCSSVTSEAD